MNPKQAIAIALSEADKFEKTKYNHAFHRFFNKNQTVGFLKKILKSEFLI